MKLFWVLHYILKPFIFIDGLFTVCTVVWNIVLVVFLKKTTISIMINYIRVTFEKINFLLALKNSCDFFSYKFSHFWLPVVMFCFKLRFLIFLILTSKEMPVLEIKGDWYCRIYHFWALNCVFSIFCFQAFWLKFSCCYVALEIYLWQNTVIVNISLLQFDLSWSVMNNWCFALLVSYYCIVAIFIYC